jgi:hypothetical protein
MSYREIEYSNIKPDDDNNINYSSSILTFAWLPKTTSPVNFGASSSGYSSGYNMTFAKHTAYVTIWDAAGVSVSNSSYNPIAPQYQGNYFDVINLPAGVFEIILRYSGSSNSQTLDGTLAYVNNSNSALLSTKIKTSDKYRNNLLRQIITAPSGGLELGLRILAGNANYSNQDGFAAQSLVILKKG